jgi:hypothetical protein
MDYLAALKGFRFGWAVWLYVLAVVVAGSTEMAAAGGRSVVDPVSVIVTALAAGAGSGLKDAASSAVTDAYQRLKALARRKVAARHDGALVLDRHEQDPQTWDRPLAGELAAAGAGQDAALVAAAQDLLGLVDAAGTEAGKYQVAVHGSQGVQVGDHNTQHNTFTQPPGR